MIKVPSAGSSFVLIVISVVEEELMELNLAWSDSMSVEISVEISLTPLTVVGEFSGEWQGVELQAGNGIGGGVVLHC